jgi:hypothetical protein
VICRSLSVVAAAGVLASVSAAPAERKRFDPEVREDLFHGFAGDKEALARGVVKCDDMLKAEPKHAEAMVWRGAARVFAAGQEFQAKKNAEGMKLWTTGLADMDQAVKLEPDNVGVRVPRAVVLIPVSRAVPEAMRKPLLEKARGDLEAVYAAQKDVFRNIGTHPQGELRMALAETYTRLGEADKATEQLKAVTAELKGSKYEAEAAAWLADKPGTAKQHNCIGCHVKE